jgi:hypothetical protein
MKIDEAVAGFADQQPPTDTDEDVLGLVLVVTVHRDQAMNNLHKAKEKLLPPCL